MFPPEPNVVLTVPKPNVIDYTSQLWKEQPHTPTLYIWFNVSCSAWREGGFNFIWLLWTPFARQPETATLSDCGCRCLKDRQECQLVNVHFEPRKGWSHYSRLYKYFCPSVEKNGAFQDFWKYEAKGVRFERLFQECAATTPASVPIWRSNRFRPHLRLLLPPFRAGVKRCVEKSRSTQAFFRVITRVFKGKSDIKSCNLWLPVYYRT